MQRSNSWMPILALAAMAGCASTPPAPNPAPAPAPPPAATAAKPAPAPSAPAKPEVHKTAADIQLEEGTALYDAGDFNGAIRRLSTGTDLWSGPVPLQVQGYKYLAFSYCVSNRVTLCQQQFEKALKLDPTFDLQPAEKTHPIWGPAFLRAKNPKPVPAAATPKPAAPVKPAAPATPAKPAG